MPKAAMASWHFVAKSSRPYVAASRNSHGRFFTVSGAAHMPVHSLRWMSRTLYCLPSSSSGPTVSHVSGSSASYMPAISSCTSTQLSLRSSSAVWTSDSSYLRLPDLCVCQMFGTFVSISMVPTTNRCLPKWFKIKVEHALCWVGEWACNQLGA